MLTYSCFRFHPPGATKGLKRKEAVTRLLGR